MRAPRIVAGATTAFLVLGLLAGAPSASAAPTATIDTQNTSTQRTGDIVLQWKPVAGATSYKVEIAETEGFGSSVVDSVTTTALRWVPTTPLWGTNGDRELFWRVVPQGVNADPTAATVKSFVRAQAPTTTLTAPADRATVTYPAPVTFTWAAVPGASSYELTYATAGSSSATTVKVTDTTYTPPLLVDGDYEWWVTPRFPLPSFSSDVAGTESAARAFTVVWPAASGRPVLEAPADQSFLNDAEFRWSKVDGASAYRFQLSQDPNFPSSTITVDVEVTGTVFTPVHVLPSTTYYWRVGAKNPQGTLVWSDARQFSKRMSKDAASVVGDGTRDPLTAEPKFTNISTDPTRPTDLDFDRFRLEWEAVPRATYYEVEVTRQVTGTLEKLTCKTATNSATIVATASTAQPNKLASSSPCLWNSKRTHMIAPGDDLYLAKVRAINMSAADTGAFHSTVNQTVSTVIESQAHYFRVPESARTSPTAAAAVVTQPQTPMTEVSPLLEWTPVPDAVGYIVKFYADANLSNPIGQVRTTTANVRTTGVFELNRTTSSEDAYTVIVYAASGDIDKPDQWAELVPTSGTTSFKRTAPTPAAGTVVDRAGAQLLKLTPTPADALGGASRGYYVAIYQRGSSQVYKELRVDQPMVVAAASYSGHTASTFSMTPLATGQYEFAWAVLDPVGKAAQLSPRTPFAVGGTGATNLKAVPSASGTSATLSWSSAVSAESYIVTLRATTESRTTTLTTKARAVTATSLVPGTTYEWSVKARDRYNNDSLASETGRFTVPQGTVPVAKPTITGAAAGTATISWSAVPGASRYLVRVADSTRGLAGVRPVETTSLSYTPTTPLVYGTSYSFDVRAVPPVLSTSSTRPVLATTARDGVLTVVTAPGTPSGLRLTGAPASVTATWNDLAGVARGSSVAPGYVLRYGVARADGLDPAWTTVVVGSAASKKLTGLKPGTTYAVQVAAGNSQGQSAWSHSVTARTADTSPSAPRLGKVTRGDRKLKVTWSAPTSAGSAGITGYQVETRSYSGGAWSAWRPTRVAATVRSATVTNLTNGLKTEVRIVATSRVGNSPASASAVVTPAGKPLAPTTIKAQSTKKKTVKVTWKAAPANGSKVKSYVLQYSTNGKSWKTLKSTTKKSYTWKKAKSKKTYYFRVYAKNALGTGAKSRPAVVVVK